jgi:uncharacterized sulfatase
MILRSAFVALVLCALFAPAVHAAPAKPNIIYIVSDDLGYGDLGSYGQKQIRTPRLDAMAAEGLRFTDHYAGHTVCRPSRLVFLTGKHSGHTAIAGNNAHELPSGAITATSLLQNNGYQTGGAGKWALGAVGSSGHPNRQGFDFFYGYLDQSEAHDYYPENLYRDEAKERLPGNVNSGKRNVSSEKVTYAHTRITEEALAYIKRAASDEKPFYLNITWTIPHTNNEAGRHEGDGQEIPDYGIYADKNWPNPEKGFAAMVTLMDHDTGLILDLLKELGIAENTLVVFTSDNGPHQEGGHKVDFFDSNGPLKGFKRSLHDGGIRVPMIAWWPGTVKPSVSDHPSAFWDWLPTVCELAGIDAPADIDGVSFVPTLLGKEQKKHDYLFWRWSKFRAIRDGKWKGLQTNETLALYDLNKDIGEENDIAADHPEVAKRLAKIIAELE